jgi:pyridoxal phosphate enzyme (YggS family)
VTLARRYEALKDRIDAACARAERHPADVLLVAVSKTFGADVVLEAFAAGITDFGENRAQELESKLRALPDSAARRVRWHFVGPVQTNKVRAVAGAAVLVHSVDRLRLGEAIGRRARELGIVQDVLIEVNLAGERSKHGVDSETAVELATQVAQIAGVSVKGLMTIPRFAVDAERSRPYFQQLARLRGLLARELSDATELSMGMSADFEVAIEEGATIVRIGEALFGPRQRSS